MNRVHEHSIIVKYSLLSSSGGVGGPCVDDEGGAVKVVETSPGALSSACTTQLYVVFFTDKIVSGSKASHLCLIKWRARMRRLPDERMGPGGSKTYAGISGISADAAGIVAAPHGTLAACGRADLTLTLIVFKHFEFSVKIFLLFRMLYQSARNVHAVCLSVT